MIQGNEQTALEQWLAQLQFGIPDVVTTKVAAAYLNRRGDNLKDLVDAITAPMDDALVEAWYQATLADEIPGAASYPAVDWALFPSSTTWQQKLENALAKGLQWVYDEVGALCFAFTPHFATGLTPTWSPKSLAEDALLFRFELQRNQTEPEVDQWQVEVIGFLADQAHYRLEVAIIDLADPTRNPAGVPITVVLGNTLQTKLTDAGGVAEFEEIPNITAEPIHVRIGVTT